MLYPSLSWNRTKLLELIATFTFKDLDGRFNIFTLLIRVQIGATANLGAIYMRKMVVPRWVNIQWLGNFALHLHHTYFIMIIK